MFFTASAYDQEDLSIRMSDKTAQLLSEPAGLDEITSRRLRPTP